MISTVLVMMMRNTRYLYIPCILMPLSDWTVLLLLSTDSVNNRPILLVGSPQLSAM